MITDTDVNKLKTIFATKDDLDESEARTAVAFVDVQRQITNVKEDTEELKETVGELKETVGELKETVVDLKEDVKDIRLQLHGMEQNIIRAINGIKEEQETQKKQIEKLNKAVFSN